MRVEGVGFAVWGLGFRVHGSGRKACRLSSVGMHRVSSRMRSHIALIS